MIRPPAPPVSALRRTPALSGVRCGLALAVGLALAGCSSRYNPVNWFDGGAEPPATLTPEGGYAVLGQDPRPLIQEVAAMSVEPMEGGVIIRATGLPPRQGFWKPALVAENGGDPIGGTISYRFVALPPIDARPVGTPQSRQIQVGTFLSNHDLEDVREIVVRGETNQRVSRR